MRKLLFLCTILVMAGILAIPAGVTAQSDSDQPVVRAVLFYSPTCPHCHTVIKELLVPLVDQYGDQLVIIGIDTTQPDGGQLYQSAIEHYQIPAERRGVPTLVIKDIVLVGSGEIPEKFPELVQEGLAAGGIAWPDIPGFAPEPDIDAPSESSDENPAAAPAPTAAEPATLSAPTLEPTAVSPEASPTTEPELALVPAPTDIPDSASDQTMVAINEAAAAETEGEGEAQAPPSDPAGTTLAALILVAMVIALIYALWRVITGAPNLSPSGPTSFPHATSWAIPILCLLGLGVSIYLAYVEITHVEAVCGPVGNCNVVQTSPYAQIVGIPVAVLGLLNYVAIIILWGIQKYTAGPLANLSALALVGLTIFGTGFSIYLTLLEIFVIHAICAWCLSSAVIATLLMLLTVWPITGKSRLRSAFSH